MTKKSATTGQPEQTQPGMAPMIGAFVAGVVLVALVATGIVYFQQSRERGAELAAQDESARAACEYARITNTYDYSKSLDDYLGKAKQGATENVIKMLEQNWTVMRQLLAESKVTSAVSDASCGWQSGDTESAKVLVKVVLDTTNSNNPVPRRSGIAVSAGLQKSGDKWLVNKWDLVVQPTPTAPQQGQPAPNPPAPEQPAPQPGN